MGAVTRRTVATEAADGGSDGGGDRAGCGGMGAWPRRVRRLGVTMAATAAMAARRGAATWLRRSSGHDGDGGDDGDGMGHT